MVRHASLGGASCTRPTGPFVIIEGTQMLSTALRVLAYVVSRAAFIAAAIVALILGRASDLSWGGPVFVGTLVVIVALVRYATEAYTKWADEYIAWLDAGDVEKWVVWHRGYVTWSIEHRSRLLAQPAAA